jgi:hypothetical protein
LLVDINRWTVFDELLSFNFAEVVSVDTESKTQIGDIIVQGPVQAIIEFVVQVFQIFKLKIVTHHHLVQRFAEVELKKLTVKECLTDHSTNKFEKVQVVWVNVTLQIWVECDTIWSLREKRIIWVEQGSRKINKKVSSQATSINSSLSFKFDPKSTMHFSYCLMLQLGKGICENLCSFDLNIKWRSSTSLSSLIDLLSKVFLLAFEVKNIWHVVDHSHQVTWLFRYFNSREYLINKVPVDKTKLAQLE